LVIGCIRRRQTALAVERRQQSGNPTRSRIARRVVGGPFDAGVDHQADDRDG